MEEINKNQFSRINSEADNSGVKPAKADVIEANAKENDQSLVKDSASTQAYLKARKEVRSLQEKVEIEPFEPASIDRGTKE